GRDVLAVQDRSELAFGGQAVRARGFGAVGRGGGIGGLLLHAVLAVDASTGALLGPVDVTVRNRTGGKVRPRSERPTADKESQRWLDGMFSAAQVLREAARITVVADRESDIYEEFARRPAGVHLLTRVAQDRRIKTATDENASLFAFSDNLPEQARFVVTIPAAPGRKPRSAELALRHGALRRRRGCHRRHRLATGARSRWRHRSNAAGSLRSCRPRAPGIPFD